MSRFLPLLMGFCGLGLATLAEHPTFRQVVGLGMIGIAVWLRDRESTR